MKSSVVKPGEKSTKVAKSAVLKVANALRRDAIDRPEGEFLGSEDDLIERYGVSRPTIRQAAGLVSQENLLSVRRGVGGGYFVRRPNTQAVAHVAAIFLRTRQASVEEVIRAVSPLRVELARLAAAKGGPESRAALKAFLDDDRSHGEGPMENVAFMSAERKFGNLIGSMGGNQVIALFLEILYDFVNLESQNTAANLGHPERLAMYRAKRNDLAEAILEGDHEFAMIAARRCELTAADWMGAVDEKKR